MITRSDVALLASIGAGIGVTDDRADLTSHSSRPPRSPGSVVEESADIGAEEGAGAEIHVAEPWEGYREMKAADVIDRLGGADTAELAAVELYEISHRRRQTVLDAAKRELHRAQNAP
ncbi:MAG: hypothetical protein ABI323_01285 [Solirubrobacteraceae bacterium]